ncbi:uncharacterized protein SEPMUDRAFT_148936 [Sphaerulina musiva SO2202]|uniref:Uncharacterized protein n=1 Tax=Sphaerulina musiva (strain SO2202) TaxID=692275 RepID=M3D6C8_SPHMS|nr:uncharacterized protein SEPMUDRAFT_148936 [Sphaerulina musiva SO2202]EMF13735.1 hypothetical protein SEPMUDRAFT_148936 [Sphaerulina musiva SO2202]
MQDHSSNSSSQQYMAQGELCVFDDANATAFSTLSEYTDDGLFNFNLGSQFDPHLASLDAQLVGGLGPYPDMEQEPRKATRNGPYLVNSAKQQIWTSSEGGRTKLIIPGRGHPDLVGDIAADFPGFGSNTPSVSDTSGDALTPSSSPPPAQRPIFKKKGYERASVAHRRDQECFCPVVGCKNQRFSRLENLNRHNKTLHDFPRDQIICRHCVKVSHARLDKARSHWRNKHEKDDKKFDPLIEKRGTAP